MEKEETNERRAFGDIGSLTWLLRRVSTLNTRRMAASLSVVDLALGEPLIFFYSFLIHISSLKILSFVVIFQNCSNKICMYMLNSLNNAYLMLIQILIHYFM